MDPKLCLYASGANIKGKDEVERKDVYSIICVTLYVSQNMEIQQFIKKRPVPSSPSIWPNLISTPIKQVPTC